MKQNTQKVVKPRQNIYGETFQTVNYGKDFANQQNNCHQTNWRLFQSDSTRNRFSSDIQLFACS